MPTTRIRCRTCARGDPRQQRDLRGDGVGDPGQLAQLLRRRHHRLEALADCVRSSLLSRVAVRLSPHAAPGVATGINCPARIRQGESRSSWLTDEQVLEKGGIPMQQWIQPVETTDTPPAPSVSTMTSIPRRALLRGLPGAAIGVVTLVALTSCGGEDDDEDDEDD